MRTTVKSSYCLRRRAIFAVFFGVIGLIAGLGFFAPAEQVALAPVFGSLILLGTALFTINWLFISRICVGSEGIARIDWLGLVRQDVPFASMSRIDLSARPSVPLPAKVVEIETIHQLLVLDRRRFGDPGIRALLHSILEHYPTAPFSAKVRDYVASTI